MSEEKTSLLSENNPNQLTEEDCPFLKGKLNSSGDNHSDAETTSSLSQALPPGHRALLKEEDKDKCPYFKMQHKGEESNIMSVDSTENNSKQIQEDFSSSSEDEEGNPKRAKGGCPFLPSDRKRNPGLVHLPETYSTVYLSRYSAYLEQDSLMSIQRDFSQILHAKPAKNRKIFENYPIYLKHTLFYDEEILKRVRSKDVVERFFVYDKFRERGNRLLNKQRFDEALFLYERAMSCFKWLELKDQPDQGEEEKNKKASKNKDQKGASALFQNTKNNIDGQQDQCNQPEEEEKKEDTCTKNTPNTRKNKKTTKNFLEDKPIQEEVEEDEEEEKKKKLAEAAEYKNNTGEARDKIKNLISSRADELLAQQKQREEALERMRAKQQKNNNSQDEFSEKEDISDHDNEGSEDEMKQQADDNDNSDKQSLSVEGFEEDERNFSSSEEEIDIEEIQAKNKHPDETAIIMDEAEKKQLIAQEAFLRNNHKEDKEFRQKYKLFITNFTDDNVELHDGDTLIDAKDIDLRQSMLVSVYLSLGVCYMNMGNLREAMEAFVDARKLHKKGSLPLLRMAQCRLTDKSSTYEQLLEAESWMKEAFELKKDEKIFSSGTATLVVMNIRNHEQFYQDISSRLGKKIEEIKELETERLRELVERVVELNEIETEMIERGITPSEDVEISQSNVNQNEIVHIPSTDSDECLEEQLANIMEGKYYTLLEAQMYAKEKEKIERTKKNLAVFQETLDLMRFYARLDFNNYKDNQIIAELVAEYNIDMTNVKNIKRFKKLQQESMKDAFNDVEHDFNLYKWALDECMKKRKEKQSKQAKKQQQQPKQSGNGKTSKERVGSLVNTIFSKSSMGQLVIVFVALYLLVLFLRAFPVFNSFLPLHQQS